MPISLQHRYTLFMYKYSNEIVEFIEKAQRKRGTRAIFRVLRKKRLKFVLCLSLFFRFCLSNPKTAQLYKKCAAPKKAIVIKDVKSKVAAKKC